MAAGEGYGSHKDDPAEQSGLPVTGFGWRCCQSCW